MPSSPGDLPNPGIEPRSPALQSDSLPSEPLEKPTQPIIKSIFQTLVHSVEVLGQLCVICDQLCH